MNHQNLVRRLRSRAGAAAIGLGAVALVSGCQVGLGSDDTAKAAEVTDSGTTSNTVATLTPAPVAPTGTARLDGSTQGSLTASTATKYNASGAASQISIADHGPQAAFASLCGGSIDMVDSGRPISSEELEVCRQHGLQVVQFQFASDAVVLATKSETDVGGDCLSLSQINNIYRAGSPVTNWRDLGFDNVPVRAGGPDRSSSEFEYFGRTVLDAPQPSMTYLRSDYVSFSNDAGMRVFVAGSAADLARAKLASHYAQLASSKRGVVTQAKTNLTDAKATLTAARKNKTKGIVDGRSAAAQAQDQTRLDAATKAAQKARRILNRERNQYDALLVPARASQQAQKTVAALRGRIAYFRFTYYSLFEENLRPFEVSADGSKRDCVFPSEATITSGSYPLSRRLLLTTTTRSLDRTEVQDFLLRYLGSVRTDAANARMLPVSTSVLAQQRAWVQGSQQPRLVTMGDNSTTADEVAR